MFYIIVLRRCHEKIFLHAEYEEDREALISILKSKFQNDVFKNVSVTYIEEKDFTRIDISDNVSIEMMKSFISEVPDGHRMLQTLATNIEQDEYDWRDFYFSS